jgi:hypothetical protein
MVGPGEPLWPSVGAVLEQFFIPESARWFALFLRFLICGSFALVLCWSVWRVLHRNDMRQRVFLAACLGLMMAGHGLLGFVAVRHSSLDDRALASLRKENGQENHPEDDVVRWSIVSPEQSPLQLRFVLASIWPRVAAYETDSFLDANLTRDLIERQGPDGAHLVIDFSDRDSRTPTLRLKDNDNGVHLVDFIPIGTPLILWDHRLRLYRLQDKLLIRP